MQTAKFCNAINRNFKALNMFYKTEASTTTALSFDATVEPAGRLSWCRARRPVPLRLRHGSRRSQVARRPGGQATRQPSQTASQAARQSAKMCPAVHRPKYWRRWPLLGIAVIDVILLVPMTRQYIVWTLRTCRYVMNMYGGNIIKCTNIQRTWKATQNHMQLVSVCLMKWSDVKWSDMPWHDMIDDTLR